MLLLVAGLNPLAESCQLRAHTHRFITTCMRMSLTTSAAPVFFLAKPLES